MNLDIFKLINSFDSGVIILDENGFVCVWNQWMEEYSEVKHEHALHKNLKQIFDDKLDPNIIKIIDEVLASGQSRVLSPRLHKQRFPLYRKAKQESNREIIFQKTIISRSKTDDEKYFCIININDMTSSVKRELHLKEAHKKVLLSEQQMRKMAFFDSLTSLANRALFTEHFDMALAQSKRYNYMTALILIDIDHFKSINDNYGHDVGDALLVEVAKRLKRCVRESDLAARLGGDEFVVIQHKVNSVNDAVSFANKIYANITKPMQIKDIKIIPSCSIGVSIYPNDAETKDLLLKNADTAMYQVKKTGRSGWKFYSVEMHQEEEMMRKRKVELSKAIADKNIIVHYQPEIDVNNSECIGFEALVRYIDSNNKIVMPDEFINIAEQSGLISDVTLALVEEIYKTAESLESSKLYKVAINLSAIQFYDKKLMDELIKAHYKIQKNNLRLELEITESVVMENTEYAINIFNELSKAGISIAIDDFGIGYSSLGYLKSFQINKLKIDRSFIKDLNKNKQNNIVINSIISLGHNLGLEVVAEGVETQQQHEYLKNKKCDIAQGYFYSRPIDEQALLQMLSQQKVA